MTWHEKGLSATVMHHKYPKGTLHTLKPEGFPKPCLPIMNPRTWTYAPSFSIYSAFQQPFVSMAGSQSLKYEWVSAWIKIRKIEFYSSSLGGWIGVWMSSLLERSFEQSEIICRRRCSIAPCALYSLRPPCIIWERLTCKPPKSGDTAGLCVA